MCASLGLERVILVGHSLGGQIAVDCAAAWPERVGGLVLVATGARLEPPPPLALALEKDYVRAAELVRSLTWSPATPRELVDRWAHLFLSPELCPAEIARADFAAAARWQAPSAAGVRCPTMIVAGGDDLVAPPPVARALAAGLASVETHVIARAGHQLHLEAPEAFYALLDPLLATLP
jgi:pimeloyl-ACP methyl ester carboxylesterase